MRDAVEAVAIERRTLRVTARGPVPVEPPVLAVATALRVFDRYPVLDALTVSLDGQEIQLSRAEIERLLGKEGFGPVRDRRRWPQLLAQVVQAYIGSASGAPGGGR